jgi:2'-5' RNA ligase
VDYIINNLISNSPINMNNRKKFRNKKFVSNKKSNRSGGQGRNSWFSFTFGKNKHKQMDQINKTLYSYDLDIMSHNGIHMTSVFMGKSLQGKQVTVLQEANSFIKEHMKKLKQFNLKFDRFDYFPLDAPSKNRRLLVALYKPDTDVCEWNLELRKKLMEYGLCDYDKPLLPHVTIGYVKGLHLPDPLEMSKLYPDIIINGMHLCGGQHRYIDNAFSV